MATPGRIPEKFPDRQHTATTPSEEQERASEIKEQKHPCTKRKDQLSAPRIRIFPNPDAETPVWKCNSNQENMSPLELGNPITAGPEYSNIAGENDLKITFMNMTEVPKEEINF